MVAKAEARTKRRYVIHLHPAQADVNEVRARFKVLACGRRWGKTLYGVATGLRDTAQEKRIWWVAPTYQQSAVAWRLAKNFAWPIAGREMREGERVLRLGGGEFWFKSSDDPDNLRGEGLDGVILDEAAYQKEDAWFHVLRPALSDRKGWAIFISTPAEERDWFRALFDRGMSGDPDWRAWQLPSATNPFLDPAEIEDARLSMPEIVFRREYLAEFVSAAGALIQRRWLQYAEPPPGIRVAMGVDLAISSKTTADWTAAVVLGRSADGMVYVLDSQRVRASFHQVMQFIQQMASKWEPSVIGVEETQYQAAAVQELNRTTSLPVRGIRPDKDKVTRFQPLQSRYEQAQVFHSPGLPGYFEDELLGFPIGRHDDQVDAMGYAWQALAVVTAVDAWVDSGSDDYHADRPRRLLGSRYGRDAEDDELDEEMEPAA